MKKIPTLFVRDPQDMRRVTDQVHPECQWVIDGEGVATRKYDGTCVLHDAAGWWARREIKPGKTPPHEYMPISTDPVTGKTVGWEPIGQSPFVKLHAEAIQPNGFGEISGDHTWPFGTYELVGPKINRDPERYGQHTLIRHSTAEMIAIPARFGPPFTRDSLEMFLVNGLGLLGWEGIVWHHPDGRMAKLKVKDFRDLKRTPLSSEDITRGQEIAALIGYPAPK